MLHATGLSQLNQSSGGTSDTSKFKFPVKVKGSMCTLSSLYFDFKINWCLKNSGEHFHLAWTSLALVESTEVHPFPPA